MFSSVSLLHRRSVSSSKHEELLRSDIEAYTDRVPTSVLYCLYMSSWIINLDLLDF